MQPSGTSRRPKADIRYRAILRAAALGNQARPKTLSCASSPASTRDFDECDLGIPLKGFLEVVGHSNGALFYRVERGFDWKMWYLPRFSAIYCDLARFGAIWRDLVILYGFELRPIRRFPVGAYQPPVTPKGDEGLRYHAGGLLHTVNGKPRLDGRGQIKAERTGFEPADQNY